MKALIIGFIGRYNSGDEMMLDMHRHVLRHIGFTEIDHYTEWAHHVEHKPLLKRFYDPRKPYDLIIIGGGGLDFGYGFYPALSARHRFGSKVVMSSVNLTAMKPEFLRIVDSLVDFFILRDRSQLERFKGLAHKCHYLQDISTIHRPRRQPERDRLAVVIRHEPQTVCNFKPAGDCDVLVLSKADLGISKTYAAKQDLPLIELWRQPALEHVRVLDTYARVLSVGRFHGALYAATLGKQYVYLFPTYYKELPESIRLATGTMTWPQIVQLGRAHEARCKVGIQSTELASYGRATKEDYARLFRAVLKSKHRAPKPA